jgi:hypothetical protein
MDNVKQLLLYYLNVIKNVIFILNSHIYIIYKMSNTRFDLLEAMIIFKKCNYSLRPIIIIQENRRLILVIKINV